MDVDRYSRKAETKLNFLDGYGREYPGMPKFRENPKTSSKIIVKLRPFKSRIVFSWLLFWCSFQPVKLQYFDEGSVDHHNYFHSNRHPRKK